MPDPSVRQRTDLRAPLMEDPYVMEDAPTATRAEMKLPLCAKRGAMNLKDAERTIET